MFILTNEQRKCFALAPISEEWDCIEVNSSPCDQFKTYLYIDGDTAVKCILVGDTQYCEYELFERISDDRNYLLPKTPKGKAVILSSSNVLRRKGRGMSLCFNDGNIHLYNINTECSYYFNSYLNQNICDLGDFSKWIESWCNETSDIDLDDIIRFSQQKRKHIRYQEGDVFRFKIGRRLYGYGRILLDYDMMRKNKVPLWDILMGKHLICSVFHIVTERSDVSVDELKEVRSLPSTIIMDDALYYGEYEIIGNLPITDIEDYPIMYGNSLDVKENAVCYQCGKIYRKIMNESAICTGFTNNAVSNNLNFTLDILMQCIKQDSNKPYWENYYSSCVMRDLRNPIHKDKLEKIKAQFQLI